MREAEAHSRPLFSDFQNVGNLRPFVIRAHATVDYERHIPLLREVEETFPTAKQFDDPRLNNRSLDFQHAARGGSTQLSQGPDLPKAGPGRIHHPNRNGALGKLREHGKFGNETTILELIRNGFQGACWINHPSTHALDAKREMAYHRENSQRLDATRLGLPGEDRPTLRIGKMAIQVKQQIYSHMVVDIDQAWLGCFGIQNINFVGRKFIYNFRYAPTR
jgi:hypothetical protein